MKNTYRIYKARDGWRWRLVASNGRLLANGGEAYTRKAKILNAIQSITTRPFKVEVISK